MKNARKLSYKEWFAILQKIAEKNHYHIDQHTTRAELGVWRQFYDHGYTPERAWQDA